MISEYDGPEPGALEQGPSYEAVAERTALAFAEALGREAGVVQGEVPIIEGPRSVFEEFLYKLHDEGVEPAPSLIEVVESAGRLRTAEGDRHEREYPAALSVMRNLIEATVNLDHVMSVARKAEADGEPVSTASLLSWLDEGVRSRLAATSRAHETQSEVVLKQERVSTIGGTAHGSIDRRLIEENTTYRRVPHSPNQ